MAGRIRIWMSLPTVACRVTSREGRSCRLSSRPNRWSRPLSSGRRCDPYPAATMVLHPTPSRGWALKVGRPCRRCPPLLAAPAGRRVRLVRPRRPRARQPPWAPRSSSSSSRFRKSSCCSPLSSSSSGCSGASSRPSARGSCSRGARGVRQRPRGALRHRDAVLLLLGRAALHRFRHGRRAARRHVLVPDLRADGQRGRARAALRAVSAGGSRRSTSARVSRSRSSPAGSSAD